MSNRQRVERRPWVGSNFKKFFGECVRKKKLSDGASTRILNEAKSRGETLFRYKCNHCMEWHITRMDPDIYKNFS